MQRPMHYSIRRHLAVVFACLAAASCSMPPTGAQHAAPADGAHARIAVLETTDIHSNIMSFDFYKLADDQELGLVRAATLIRAARREFDNTLLFDDGDTIQGSALADYQALVKPPACDQELA